MLEPSLPRPGHPPSPTASPETLAASFERQAAQTPERVAARSGANTLTYDGLNARANRLAHHLRRLGARPGLLVGVSGPRTLEMLVAVLAVLKAGAAYVPLDPAYPARRLAFMLADSGSPLLITWGGPRRVELPFDGRQIDLDAEAAAIAAEPAANPVSGAMASDLAYVIYTSGSTGQPKGVEIAHGSAVTFVHDLRAHLHTSVDDVFLSVASLSFDMSVLDIFLPLCSGASVVVAPAEVTANPLRLLAALDESRATSMQATPSSWKMLVDAGLAPHPRLTALVGGERLPQDLAEALRDRLAAVWNLYGPTEATVYATLARYQGGTPTIGGPLAHTQVFILDERGEPVEPGQVGELHIAGKGLARGYRNRPDLTQDKFIEKPAPGGSGLSVRLYKTGDLARHTAGGDIECLGRIDHQVKIRGYRIELSEIEAVLRSHPAVRDGVVIDVPDATGVTGLAAYFVDDTAAGTPPRELREHLLSQLPAFMVPPVFIRLPQIPLGPNGKVDRQTLLAAQSLPDLAAPAISRMPPRTELEAGVHAVWCEALRQPRIGLHDRFFEIGGHSLMAVSLTMRLEEKFGTAIPLDALWNEGGTVEGMAALIQAQLDKRAPTRLVHLKTGRPGATPLFVVHTMRGSVNEYQAFASRLPGEHPVIGLRSKGLLGDEVPEADLRQFARDAVEALRQTQPKGPYMLAGYSIGGLIAYEMALLLHAQQQHVAFLGLFDTPAPGFAYGTPVPVRLKARWQGARRRVRRLLDPVRGSVMSRIGLAGADPGLDGTDPSRISRHAMALFESLRAAEAAYQVTARGPFPIDLFVARSFEWTRASDALGWTRHAQAGVTCHRLPAPRHEDLMSPDHADSLARAVHRCWRQGNMGPAHPPRLGADGRPRLPAFLEAISAGSESQPDVRERRRPWEAS